MNLNVMNVFVFFIMLIWAGWQDFRKRSIAVAGLAFFGGLGVLFCALLGKTSGGIIASCGIGVILLGVSRLTKGAIGEGDGWFFIVSGLYLPWQENLLLFVLGLGVAFLVSLIWIVVGGVRKMQKRKSLPFLSCLMIPGIWIFLSGPAFR